MCVEFIDIDNRASLIRDRVKMTWCPPRKTGNESPGQIAQTSMMLGLAFIFGKKFLGELTENQNAAIDSGLELLNSELLGKRL